MVVNMIQHGKSSSALDPETHYSARSLLLFRHSYFVLRRCSCIPETTVDITGVWALDFVSGLQAPLMLSVRQTCEQRFVSAMKELSSSKEMKQLELFRVVLHAKVTFPFHVFADLHLSDLRTDLVL